MTANWKEWPWKASLGALAAAAAAFFAVTATSRGGPDTESLSSFEEECRALMERVSRQVRALDRLVLASAPIKDAGSYIGKPAPPPPPPEPATEAEKKEDEQVILPADISKWKLLGIMEEAGRRIAIVNDEVVRAGDQFERFTVTEISSTSLKVEDDTGRLHVLEFYEGLGRKE